jgi:hypothetical protein
VDYVQEQLDVIRRRMSPFGQRLWREVGGTVLLAAAISELVLAYSTVRVALNSELGTRPTGLSLLLVGVSGVLVLSGVLTLFRRRRELIERLLGSSTTAAFALALVFLSRPETEATADSLLALASLFGLLLLVTVVFADRIATDGKG